MISIVIPTLNAAERIGPCLGALTPGLMAGLVREVVIADGGSGDGIEAVADLCGARLVRAKRGRGGQIAAGVAAAKGEWLMILHADTVLSPDWPEAARAHIERRPGRAGWFRLRFDDPGAAARLVAGWANLRARLFALPYGDQGLLIRSDVLARAGGVPPIPLMEDVALARALGRRRLAPLAAVAVTSAERYRRDGWLRRGARNLGLVARFLLGAAPERLAARYDR